MGADSKAFKKRRNKSNAVVITTAGKHRFGKGESW